MDKYEKGPRTQEPACELKTRALLFFLQEERKKNFFFLPSLPVSHRLHMKDNICYMVYVGWYVGLHVPLRSESLGRRHALSSSVSLSHTHTHAKTTFSHKLTMERRKFSDSKLLITSVRLLSTPLHTLFFPYLLQQSSDCRSGSFIPIPLLCTTLCV